MWKGSPALQTLYSSYSKHPRAPCVPRMLSDLQGCAYACFHSDSRNLSLPSRLTHRMQNQEQYSHYPLTFTSSWQAGENVFSTAYRVKVAIRCQVVALVGIQA